MTHKEGNLTMIDIPHAFSAELPARPSYDQLPEVPGRPGTAHAWDVWGRDDSLGAMNLLGPAQVLQAARLVREGRVINLDLPLDQPRPGLFPKRPPYEHELFAAGSGRDDVLNGFYPQGSTQWDGLRHVRYREFYWGGRTESDVDAQSALGVEHWAERGIVGRGVLADVAGYHELIGQPISFDDDFEITVDLLEEVLSHQGVAVDPGTTLLVRTGWLDGYQSAPADVREAMRGTVGNGFRCPGIESTRRMAGWLWDMGIVAVAADNPAVEVLPVDPAKGFLHRRLIALQGTALGEFWTLTALAAACNELARYEFMLVSSPLNLPGGVGSPANAYAIL